MWPLVMYSNYFETVSTVMNQTHFQVCLHLTLYYCMIITILWLHGMRNMCSAWFLDIRISTCFLILL